MRLENKTAIVTGGASGFGEGIVRKFLNEGAETIIADINSKKAKKLANQLGEKTSAFYVDIGDWRSVQKLQKETSQTWGKIDIVVNNAGATHLPTPLDKVTEEDFDRVFSTNCKSVYLMAKAFVPNMKARKAGIILNVASTAAISPRPNLSWYNSSKGWMNTATKSMAIELAPYGIRVNAINPVAGEPPLLASFMGEDTPAVREKFLASIPLGRFSTPGDIANATCFLCSEEASMITGVCMEIDGGRCI